MADHASPSNDFLHHVLDLARAFDVRMVMDTKLSTQPKSPEESPRAAADTRLVHTAFVMDERSYAAALHEMGHVLSPSGSLWQHMDGQGAYVTPRNIALLLEQEDAAWEWAHCYALVWTNAMTALQDWARETYVKSCERFLAQCGAV